MMNMFRPTLGRMTMAAGVIAAAMMGASGAAQADDWSTVTDATPWADIGATVAVSPPKVAFLVPFIAKAEGFFDKEHLRVNLVPETSGVPAFLSTATGSTKFAFTSATDPIIAASKGTVARVIWSYGMKLDTVCVGGKGINSPKDLVGKNVGVTDTGGFAQTLLEACLSPDNVDMKSVKQINMQRSGFVPALITNRISAAVFHADGAYTVLNKMPNDSKVLAYESETLPLWWYGALATNDSYAKDHAPEVKRFLRALITASRWMQDPANRDKAIADGVKASGEDPAAVAYAFDIMVKNNIWPKNEGLPSRESFDFTAGKLKAFGQIDAVPSYDATIDGSFVNDVLSVIGKVAE